MHRQRCKHLKYRKLVAPTSFACLECDTTVVADGVGRPWKFCSPHCASTFGERRLRAQTAGVEIRDLPGLIDVARRWFWICAVCGFDVDRTLRFPDMASPQVDHIVPLSAGGFHGIENLQLTHRRCNISKGQRRDHYWVVPSLLEMLSARPAA